MAEPFLAEIKIVSFNFAPKGWALCNGQLLPINQNQALFSLLGTTYGGNGQTTFALPEPAGPRADPRRRRAHPGRSGGRGRPTRSPIAEMPAHTHFAQGRRQRRTAPRRSRAIVLGGAQQQLLRAAPPS